MHIHIYIYICISGTVPPRARTEVIYVDLGLGVYNLISAQRERERAKRTGEWSTASVLRHILPFPCDGPSSCVGVERIMLSVCRGSSLIRNRCPLGPYSRHMHRAIW